MRYLYFYGFFYLLLFFYSSFSYGHSVQLNSNYSCSSNQGYFGGSPPHHHDLSTPGQYPCTYSDRGSESDPTPDCPEKGSSSKSMVKLPRGYSGEVTIGGCSYTATPAGGIGIYTANGDYYSNYNMESNGPIDQTSDGGLEVDPSDASTHSEGSPSDPITGETSSSTSTNEYGDQVVSNSNVTHVYEGDTHIRSTTTTSTTTSSSGAQSSTVTRQTQTTYGNGVTTTNTSITNTDDQGVQTVVGTSTSTEPPEDGEQSSVSGGGSCSSPPSCDGDAVQCAILIQQFHDRCNTDKTATAPLDCSASFQCDGDAIQCAMLKIEHDEYCSIQQYKDITADSVFQDADLSSVDNLEAGSSWTDDNTDEIDTEINSFVSDITSAGGDNTAQCPDGTSVSFGQLGDVEVSYTGICGLAEVTRPLLILLATFYSLYGLVQVLRGNK